MSEFVVVVVVDFWFGEEEEKEKEKEKKSDMIWVVHHSILWILNQMVIIILKIIDIKKLTERTKTVNDRRFIGPN